MWHTVTVSLVMSARHTSWARRTKSRGPKGFQLEVRAQRAPRLLVYTISSILSTFVNCHLLKYVLSISSILIPCPPYLSIWSTFIDILTFHPFHLFSSLLIYFQPFLCRWGLLADRYGLPIRDYWQTVRSANKRLLAYRSQNMWGKGAKKKEKKN